MPRKFILFLFSALCVAQTTPQTAIRAVLDKQVADWNRSDIPAFMDGYDKDTTFVGATTTKGSRQVLQNYLRKYPTKEAMGQLTFSDLEITPLDAGSAYVIGKWHLARNAAGGGDTGGVFSLIFRKTASGWKVILDHTS